QQHIRDITEQEHSPLSLNYNDDVVQFYKAITIPRYNFSILYKSSQEKQQYKQHVENVLGFEAKCEMLFDEFPLHKQFIKPFFDIIEFYRQNKTPTYLFAQGPLRGNHQLHPNLNKMQKTTNNAVDSPSYASTQQGEEFFENSRYFVLGFNEEGTQLYDAQVVRAICELLK
ncbi:hypothetical protein D6774_00970, partial [Candidatus Woesearchaeota archaeon]